MKQQRPDDSSDISWKANDGTALTLRHVRAEDAAILMSFVRGLSFGARYFRYGHGDVEFSEDEILRVCTPDPNECVHLLVLKIERGTESVIGSARIVFEAGGSACEIAIAVTDAWQRRRIGSRLMNALFESARRRGIKEFRAQILASNRRMIEFMRRRGFTISDSIDGPSLKIAVIAR